jgi:NADH-quinone oxidoreductase subunit G
MFALKDLMARSARQHRLPSGRREARSGSAARATLQRDHRRHRQADAILIVGSNPRKEAPVLNARIRKRWLRRRSDRVIGERPT